MFHARVSPIFNIDQATLRLACHPVPVLVCHNARRAQEEPVMFWWVHETMPHGCGFRPVVVLVCCTCAVFGREPYEPDVSMGRRKMQWGHPVPVLSCHTRACLKDP